VIVNDRPDIALLSRSDGVHLGEEDLSAESARRALSSGALVGVSTHSVSACRLAMEDPAVSYVALGPIFATGSKSTSQAPLGLAAVEAAAAGRKRPLVVIGGISPDDVGSCLAAGADAVAMIAGLLDGDPNDNVRRARASAERAGGRVA